MAANGFQADLDALAEFVDNVNTIHGTAHGVVQQYYQHVGVPDFGQGDPLLFEPAATLAGTYIPRQTDHQASLTSLFGWIQTMSNAASIIHQRYGNAEALNSASADDIKKVLEQAAAQVTPAGG